MIAKLGGSVITDLSKPLTYRSDVASALSEEIASSDERVVVVHGRGSFGRAPPAPPMAAQIQVEGATEGTALARSSAYELNRLMCKTMMEAKLSPFPFFPFDALMRAGPTGSAQWLRSLLKENFTPVTFGDYMVSPKGLRFQSGDEVTVEMARMLKPERCIFALDVDGVYEPGSRVIVPELSPGRIRKGKVADEENANSKIKQKLEVAARIASYGTTVCFVSGYRRNEFSKALRGLDFYGTMVRS